MYIKKISIHNFKSIDNIEMDLRPLTMLVGANAAGKSNIIDVFRFIENIVSEGIDNAIAFQGGIQYLSNAILPKGERIEISFTLDIHNEGYMRHLRSRKYCLKMQDIDYKFIIQPNKRGTGYHIAYDYITISYDCYSFDANSKDTNSKDKRFNRLDIQCKTSFERKKQLGSIKFSYSFQSVHDVDPDLENELKNDRACDFFTFIADEDKTELMLNRLSILLPPNFSDNTFIRIFDFDPKEMKKPSSMTSSKILEENGSNLASILQTILRKKENKIKLTYLLKDFLPFIDAIFVENNPDKSFSYKIRECYNNKSFYANFMSDGTVSIIALIIALFFEEKSNIIVLEEPERNIHPKLLFNLLSSAEDVSKEKQIVITTHNPEFLKHAHIDDVIFVSRDPCGRTYIRKPIDSEIIKEFINNDLGLDDLFIQGLLGE